MKNGKQIPKELLSLAGEHRVASELCKLGLFATITPGKRKQTDLYAFNDTSKQFVRIEVKASQTNRFITGISQRRVKPGYDPPDFWVLVSFKEQSERFFVLKNDEIEKLQDERNKPYLERFRATHGEEFNPRDGVDNLLLENVETVDHENRWDKISNAVGITGRGTG